MKQNVHVVFYNFDDLIPWLFRMEELEEEGFDYISSITKIRGRLALLITYSKCS